MPALLVGSCSSSLAPNIDEAMSASSRVAQGMEEAKSEASWTAQAKEKGRGWSSIDLEGEVEELGAGCPWTVTKGDSMDPEGEMNHQSDGKQAAIEEVENLGKLKDDEMVVEMEVDAGVPQAESAGIKSPKRKVIRVDSEETQDYGCESVQKKQRSLPSCRVHLASHEEPFLSAIIGAVKKRSDAGSLRRWSLKKVEKLDQ